MCVGFQCRLAATSKIFIYISNESSVNVFFDNMQVRHDRGRIIEENHYYAFGLKIAAISSKAYGAPNNNYLYQGDFSDFDDDLGWNDFELRSYDPQIGRFLQNDPYDQFASGYVGMGNDPANNIDPSGGWASTGIFEGASAVGKIAATTIGGAIIGGVVDALTGGNGFTGAAIGAGIGLASNFASGFNFSGIGSILKGVAPSLAANAMNATIFLREQSSNFISVSSNPVGDGSRDAIINALLLGAPDVYDAFMGNNPLDRYTNTSDAAAYTLSRVTTDGLIAKLSRTASNAADATSGAAQLIAIAGSGTVVLGVGSGAVAGIAKILSLYGKAVFAAAIADVVVATAYMAKYNKHHNDPKMYGGDPKQPNQTIMPEQQHKDLHKLMQDFMRSINKRLLPAPGRNGPNIVREFTREYILKKLAKFYKSKEVQKNYKKAADNFFKLHPGLK